ncbi:MAG: type III PLP-dependent enzyme [Rickettsiales bacterium]|nr:type III PLP-dependent enzyme [Rickettsiales bacterium]
MDKRNLATEDTKVHYLFDKDSKADQFNIDYASLRSVEEELGDLKPAIPTYFLRPHSLKKAANFFLNNFVGGGFVSRVLYSVKGNPGSDVLKCLFDSGIRNFDVASIEEVRLLDDLFGKRIKNYYMHPVKSRESIKEAYFDFAVKDFSLDSFEELYKILESTDNATDLGLHVRLAIPNAHSVIDLTGKFGILPSESIELLKEVKNVAKKTGICFHVGSQCMEASQYRSALDIVYDILEESQVEIDVLDIGGGFPSSYPGMMPANMSTYFDEIFDAISGMELSPNCEIWCEPGRALVAESGSLVVRVEGRKQNMLYINDGTYGGLFDAGSLNFIYPARAIRFGEGGLLDPQMEPFGFYGPTCDSLDVMKGPFYLPRNIKEGDYIEIGQMGSYSKALRTNFNGFGSSEQRLVKDEPLLSNYGFEDSLDNLEKKSSSKVAILKQKRV